MSVWGTVDPQIFAYENACIYIHTMLLYTACPIGTKNGSKRVVPRQDVFLGVRTIFPQILGVKTPKN